MAIVTTVPQQQSDTQRLYTTKAKINTEVVVGKSSGRWPGANLSGSSWSSVRPRHTPDSPSSLSRILMRPSTFHSLHAHTTHSLVGTIQEIALTLRLGERSVRYWGRRRRGWWLYRISWRHNGDVTVATSLTVPPTARPARAATSPPARACANGTASMERSFSTTHQSSVAVDVYSGFSAPPPPVIAPAFHNYKYFPIYVYRRVLPIIWR